MPAAALIAGGSILSAGIGAWGANKAAKTQSNATLAAMAAEQQRYNETKSNFQPYLGAGKGAITSLAQLYGINADTGDVTGQPFNEESLAAFRRSPDYEFARTEGTRGLEFTAAGKGGLLGGNTLRDLSTFNQGLATQNFGNYFSRLLELSKFGQGSASALAGQGGKLSDLAMAKGQADASGIVGMTNAATSGITGGTQNLMLWNLLNKGNSSAYGNLQPGGSGTGLGSYGAPVG